jgi:hypothetical protein
MRASEVLPVSPRKVTWTVRVFWIMKVIRATAIRAAAQTPTHTRPVRVLRTCWRGSVGAGTGVAVGCSVAA